MLDQVASQRPGRAPRPLVHHDPRTSRLSICNPMPRSVQIDETPRRAGARPASFVVDGPAHSRRTPPARRPGELTTPQTGSLETETNPRQDVLNARHQARWKGRLACQGDLSSFTFRPLLSHPYVGMKNGSGASALAWRSVWHSMQDAALAVLLLRLIPGLPEDLPICAHADHPSGRAHNAILYRRALAIGTLQPS
jgi:hypothetical protein